MTSVEYDEIGIWSEVKLAQRNDPLIAGFPDASDSPGLTDKNPKALVWIVATPVAVEAVLYAKVHAFFCAFGNYCNVCLESVKRLALSRQGHFAVPD
jgi:hypothetical protein